MEVVGNMKKEKEEVGKFGRSLCTGSSADVEEYIQEGSVRCHECRKRILIDDL